MISGRFRTRRCAQRCRKAKIDYPDVPVYILQNLRTLEISVYDPEVVSGFERGRHLNKGIEGLRDGTPENFSDVCTLNVFSADEWVAFSGIKIENSRDVRMGELPRFATRVSQNFLVT